VNSPSCGGGSQRYARTLDDADASQRARALDDDARAIDAQSLAQALVGTRFRPQPLSRKHCNQRHAKRACQEPTTIAQPQFERGHERSHEARAGQDLERLFGRHDIEQDKDQQATDTGADEIGRVDAPDLLLISQQREPDGVGRAEERYRQYEVGRCEPQRLPRVPQQLLGAKRQTGRDQRRDDREDAERQEIRDECARKTIEEPAPRQRNERAARAESEQREADHHVREVVPVDDGEESCQQDFVRERGAGDDGDGPDRQAFTHGRRSRART